MICPSCGKMLFQRGNFCPLCGAPIGGAAELFSLTIVREEQTFPLDLPESVMQLYSLQPDPFLVLVDGAFHAELQQDEDAVFRLFRGRHVVRLSFSGSVQDIPLDLSRDTLWNVRWTLGGFRIREGC